MAEARDAGAPATRIAPVTDTVQGVAITDQYRWLENAADPEVHAWTAAQSARTRAYLDALPYRSALADRLLGLISQTSPSYSDLRAVGGKIFAVHFDPHKQQPMLAVMGADANAAHARDFLDPNTLDPTGGTAFDWYVPSPDGKLVAVSLSRGGSEDGDLHVFDVATGRDIGETIPHVQYPTAGGSAAWSDDGQTIYYTRFPGAERPEADRHFYQTVWRHKLGTPISTDAQVFGNGLPRVAEIELRYSYEAHALLIAVANGDGGQFAHYVLDNSGVHQITRFEDGVDFAAFGPDRALYLVSKHNASRRQILKLAPGDYDLSHARVIVPEGPDVIFTDFSGDDPLAFPGNLLAVKYLAGGPNKVKLFGLDGAPRGEAAVPPVASVDEIEAVGNDLLYSVETYVTPRAFHRRLANGRDVLTSLRVTSPVNFNDMEVVRVMATSKDGTQVPVNIIRKKGIRLDGTNPTLLYGYGGYGISETPYFLGPSRRLFFDAGGVFVTANIRGGGEFGEDWHTQGALTHKQNVFDDFAAAAQLLIDQHYTSPQHLAIRGGSNGGLLMGAMITQHPEMFRAVASSVGIYDMLRVELDPNGEFNTTEFGTVTNPDQFRALYAYSPYHHVQDGVAYPAVLMQTGENDGRVNPMQSRKMTARLQAATSGDRPIFLLTTDAAGHGIGSPLSVQVGQTADWLAFVFDQLGMKWEPSASAPPRIN
ncbi:MAG: prolyl oligopeptidase family serine peptidase [Pseudomonadota bacterium]